ncbi:hypothetical protein SUGI_0172430 [Cryptomeria japonica]|nr:hypothetical protein SUGI_0172430 [Cryptomeria japonica]
MRGRKVVGHFFSTSSSSKISTDSADSKMMNNVPASSGPQTILENNYKGELAANKNGATEQILGDIEGNRPLKEVDQNTWVSSPLRSRMDNGQREEIPSFLPFLVSIRCWI